MEKPLKSRGFKGKPGWKRSVYAVNNSSKKAHPEAPEVPKPWTVEGASECTVRLHKSLRKMLKEQLHLENLNRKSRNLKKNKEVEAVNQAVYNWICNTRCNDLLGAKEAILVLSGSFDNDAVLALLGKYHRYISKESYVDKKANRHGHYLRFDRRLRSSSVYRRDLAIVVSYLTDYEVVERYLK